MSVKVIGSMTGQVSGDLGTSAGDHRKSDRLIGLLLFSVIVLGFGARSAASYRPLSYLVGDCPYYAATAVSLVYDHDLDLRNQLQGGLEIHGRQIAVGRDGAWYPKHPILMPIVAAPFVIAFGIPGTLLFNLLVLGLLAVVLMRLARTVAGPRPAALAALVLILGTFVRRYDYNFSPDLFATLVLALGLLALVRARDGAGGALLGLTVCAKLTDLFLVPLGLLYVSWCRGWRGLLRAAVPAALPLLALGTLNLAHFGSPWITSYDRNVAIEDGVAVTIGHRGLFDQGLVGGLTGELFDRIHGLVPTSPALLLAVPGFVLLFRRRPRDAVLFLVIGEFLLLFFATYRYWPTSHYGNRFLMPLVAISAPAVALALERIADRAGAILGSRRRAAPLGVPW